MRSKSIAAELNSGDVIWSVASGRIDLLSSASRKACRFIAELDGFVAMNVVLDGRTLWFFESENAAKIARNKMTLEGIVTGSNICKWKVASDGVPELVDERVKGGE